MAVVKASSTWPGPDVDVLRVFVEPTPLPWGAEVADEDLVLFRLLDSREEASGQIVGLEILGFLSFDQWGDIPESVSHWRLAGMEPLALVDALKQLQREYRQQTSAGKRVA